MEAPKRPVGRPAGEPSSVINLRLPDSLLERLDRYVDWMETRTGASTNRSTIIRQALGKLLQDANY